MIIEIFDKDNVKSDVELCQEDIGIWKIGNKTNIKNISFDIVQDEFGFTDKISISLKGGE